MTDYSDENLRAELDAALEIYGPKVKEHQEAERKRQEEEQRQKEQSRWESGATAYSTKEFENFLKKGYKPTYESCGSGKVLSCDILKLACKYGIEPEDATKLFVLTEFPEQMEILVKEGKADVNKYPMKKNKGMVRQTG